MGRTDYAEGHDVFEVVAAVAVDTAGAQVDEHGRAPILMSAQKRREAVVIASSGRIGG